MRPMVTFRHFYVAGLAAVSALVLAPQQARADSDALIEGARLCTQRFPVEERQNLIPTHLLAAIATTESGRWHDGLGMSVPWPWTINVEGKGYYFESKAAAIAQTKLLLSQGRQSIDVGCMQVNLKHHPKAFANLEDAFDPERNVNYAAKFLHDNYAQLGDWIKATAAYHSRTPQYGARYLTDIERSWNSIVAKVAAARQGKGAEVASASTAQRTQNPVVPSRTRIVDSGRPLQASQHARVIRVRDDVPDHRASTVMVVKPAAEQVKVTEPVKVASPVKVVEPAKAVVAVAQVAEQPAAVAPVGNSVRQVKLDSAGSSALAPASSPTFVFAN